MKRINLRQAFSFCHNGEIHLYQGTQKLYPQPISNLTELKRGIDEASPFSLCSLPCRGRYVSGGVGAVTPRLPASQNALTSVLSLDARELEFNAAVCMCVCVSFKFTCKCVAWGCRVVCVCVSVHLRAVMIGGSSRDVDLPRHSQTLKTTFRHSMWEACRRSRELTHA